MPERVKTITMYLPQFHAIPENDEWWGKGYTEWTAVKGAVPLFEGHKQPKIPLDGKCYDLMDKETMLWQSELMKRYGIDGQCFYHYYFKDGRLILEKPAENLLKWKDVDMPFCFCWDHNNWVKTWSAISGNSWTNKFEKKEGAGSNGVLLEQRYGNREVWKKHFMYLLPFFKDERYIRLNGRPVFLIHGPAAIYCLSSMIVYWRRLAEENGLDGLYIIGECAEFHMGCLDAVLLRAPHMFWKLENRGSHWGFDYDEMWHHILNTPQKMNCKTFFCGVADCDDTPRRGKSGVIAENFSVDKFQNYLSKLYCKSLIFENEFLFINAWNEWGEGMYLEPDEEHGYAYLDAVQKAQEQSREECYDNSISENLEFMQKECNTLLRKNMRNDKICKCLDRWMQLRENNIHVSQYLIKKNIHTVAIYGIGVLGKHLLYEFKNSQIDVKYLIDKNTQKRVNGYNLVAPCEELGKVDAIIITVVNEFDSIYEDLKNRIDAELMSIEELIYEL